MIRFTILTALLAALVFPAAAEEQVSTTTVTVPAKSLNIMDTLKSDGRFKTLVRALEDTKLADSLRAEGPFTLFAPTDDAFKALPNVNNTLGDGPHIKALLNNHLAGKALTLADLSKSSSVTMINGEVIALANGGRTIGQSAIVVPEIIVKNGVIHGIDRVLTQSVEKKKESAVQQPSAPTNAYLPNDPPGAPLAEVAAPAGSDFRIVTEERVRRDGSVEKRDVVVPVIPPVPPAETTVVTTERVAEVPVRPVERKILIEERTRADGTVERKEVVIEERPVREVSVGGELKTGVDKTYDGLKTGARKFKSFFTGN